MKSIKSAAMLLLLATACLLIGAPARDGPSEPGDANHDGVVDGADYTIWADNYEPGVGGKTWEQGDFTGDGIVDGADYCVWADNFLATYASVTVTIQNNTGQAKTNWPVFLTVWKVLGANLDMAKLNPAGFHVYDESGAEIPHMLRHVPPEFSLGNDEIVFIIPEIASGQTLTYRVSNSTRPGLTQEIDLIDNANNLLPNGGFETDSGGVPTGYTVTSNDGVIIGFDTEIKHSGDRSLLLTFPLGRSATLKTTNSITIRSGGHYHFSIWAKTENVSYNGWGFWNCGGVIKFDSTAFTGRSELTLRDTREWFCYRFESDDEDAWGVPIMGSKGTGNLQVKLSLGGYEQSQLFLQGAAGYIWFDEALLFEQPTITVDRQTPLAQAARNGAVIAARPVNMPRYKVFAHEAVEELSAYAMRGERRRIRLAVHAVQALQNLQVSVHPFGGPDGRASPVTSELERLAYYVTDYAAIAQLAAGETAEYLLSMDVPADAQPGVHHSVVVFSADGQVLDYLPLQLEVLPVDVPSMEGVYVGGIYNIGYPLDRDDRFYTCYGKARFTYLMLFDYFSTHMIGEEVDLPGAQQQVDKITTLAHVTSGIGLYREPNMSEDQPRKWYQIASGDPDYHGPYTQGTDEQYKPGYQALAAELENYADQHGWPDMIYMVSDEPDRAADKDPSMGWLNDALPNAITNCDAQYRDMIATWGWYNLPILDDPANWTGPMMYDYVTAHEGRFGICGTAWGLASGRYQAGMMMASSGAIYWHWWHTQGPFEEIEGKVVRMHHVAAMGAGVNDLRYYLTLADRIEGSSDPAAAEAQSYLDGVFSFCTADHDRHLLPYNGVPADWGYDRFYDDWRARMKDYILLLQPAAARRAPRGARGLGIGRRN